MRRILVLEALSGTNRGQSKDTLIVTNKTFIGLIIDYACPAWAHAASDTSISKLQSEQIAALRIMAGCTKTNPIDHLHSECKLLNVRNHHKLNASQFALKNYEPLSPLHFFHTQQPPPQTTPKHHIRLQRGNSIGF